jgi:hypothetical protein
MKTEDRIEQTMNCTVINLTEPEKDIYNGAGLNLAKFANGVLVELFAPFDYSCAEEALDAAFLFADADGVDVWLVMCSCYQLCEPVRINIDDNEDVAYLSRVICDEFEKFEWEMS